MCDRREAAVGDSMCKPGIKPPADRAVADGHLTPPHGRGVTVLGGVSIVGEAEIFHGSRMTSGRHGHHRS